MWQLTKTLIAMAEQYYYILIERKKTKSAQFLAAFELQNFANRLLFITLTRFILVLSMVTLSISIR